MLYLNYNEPIVPMANFIWGEYCRLREWNYFLIPSDAQKESAIFLFTKLQPLRKKLGKPLIVKSGARDMRYTQYLRAQGLPAAIGSAHIYWEAVDLSCPELENEELWEWFDLNWEGRMELLKFTPTWVHLDIRNWGSRMRFKP